MMLMGKATGATALAMVLLVAACGDGKDPLPGQRLDIRDGLITAPRGEVNQSRPITLGAAAANADWTHPGGAADHDLGHVALGGALQPVFRTAIGEGDSRQARITADPVVAGGRIFTMDARSLVSAVGQDGALLWQADVKPNAVYRGAASGGGLATDGKVVYVTTGYGRTHALDAATGASLWVQDMDAPGAAAPTVANNLVYVTSRDSRAWVLDAATGRVRWQINGTPSATTIDGGAGAAVSGGKVVLPFPSGEIVGAYAAGGMRLWSQIIAGARLGHAGGVGATDITGGPVIAGGVGYAANAGGRIAAVDIESGNRLWTASEGASSGLSVIGGSVFFVNDINELLRLNAADGSVIWRQPLADYIDSGSERNTRVAHFGPVMAGGRLVIAGSDGVIRQFDPTNGASLGEVALPGGAAAKPAVAGQTLYIVTKDGALAAFR